jgi:hypothetical protein
MLLAAENLKFAATGCPLVIQRCLDTIFQFFKAGAAQMAVFWAINRVGLKPKI